MLKLIKLYIKINTIYVKINFQQFKLCPFLTYIYSAYIILTEL